VTQASHAPQGESHEHAAHASHKKTYMVVFVWLAVLTAIEVGIVFTGLTRFVLITLLCALAVTKAALVAMYFMHLRFERRTLALVVITPIVLAAILIIGLMPDTQAWVVGR
jgi:cytochrome c oxidase subunit 4